MRSLKLRRISTLFIFLLVLISGAPRPAAGQKVDESPSWAADSFSVSSQLLELNRIAADERAMQASVQRSDDDQPDPPLYRMQRFQHCAISTFEAPVRIQRMPSCEAGQQPAILAHLLVPGRSPPSL